MARSSDECALLPASGDPESIYREEEERVKLEAWLDRALSPRERECVRLRCAGLSYAAIAAALGIETGTVSALLARGLVKLRTRSESMKQPMMPNLSCDAIADRTLLELDGGGCPPAEAAAHVGGCAACQIRLARIRADLSAMGAALGVPAGTVEVPAFEDLWEGALTAGSGPSLLPGRSGLLRCLGGIAAEWDSLWRAGCRPEVRDRIAAVVRALAGSRSAGAAPAR